MPDESLSRTQRFVQDPWFRLASCVPLLVFTVYLALALHSLYVTHPMEDAYILFHYVENFVGGHGIVFYPGGPRAEGATDCLWFLLLSMLTATCFDVAVAAGFLNALGAGLASALCIEAIRVSSCRGPWILALALLSLPVLAIGGALASCFGFSALLYSALALLIFSVALHARPRALAWIPVLSLVLGLFRADGVLLGVAYTLVGGWFAIRAGTGRRYLFCALTVLVLGASYFALRFHYFGLPLPLPLYVKENTQRSVDLLSALLNPRAHFPGFSTNMAWTDTALGPRYLLVCGAVLAWMSRGASARVGRMLVLFAPSLVLLVALSLVRQTQNFAFRFQAPVLLVVYYANFWLLVQICCGSRSWLKRVLACGLFVAALWPMVDTAASRLQAVWKFRSYLDTFPALLARVLQPGRVIALTDAGRIPFWTGAHTVDVVGLNTPSAAFSVPTREDLDALDPDIVMFSTSGTFDFGGPGATGPRVVPLTRDQIRAALVPAFGPAFDGGPSPGGVNSTREYLATLTLGRHVHQHPEYDVYAVSYLGQYSHVWGFKRDLEELPAIMKALGEVTSGATYFSYLDLVEQRAREVGSPPRTGR